MRVDRSKLIFIALLLLIVLLEVVYSFHHKKVETIAPQTTAIIEVKPLPVIDQEQGLTYNEANAWLKIGDTFATDADTPQVIYLSNQKVLYVRDSQLFSVSFNKAPVSLYRWESTAQAQIWRLGNGFLIGSMQGTTGVFQYVRPSDKEGMPFEYHEIKDPRFKDQAYGPEKVLEIKYSPETDLAFITFAQQPNPIEYIFDPNSSLFQALQLELNVEPGQDYYAHSYFLHKPVPQKNLVIINPVKKWADKTFTFEDERGTIFYSKNDINSIMRFGDLKVVQLKQILQDGGSPQYYLRVKDKANNDFINRIGTQAFYPFSEKMWHEDWNSFHENAFYHLDAKNLETVSYECDICKPFKIKSEAYSLDSLRYVEKLGPLLKFTQNGNDVLLSLYDATRYETSTNGISQHISQILMKDLALHETSAGDKPFRGNEAEPKKTIELPAMQNSEQNTNMPVPEDVLKVVSDQFFSGSGDASPSVLYRKVGTSWYVLIETKLYVFQDKKLNEVGTLPIKTTIQITNYSIGLGAQDFTKLADDWFVADTVGNRILKLDQKLNIVKELPLPSPSAIHITETEQLVVVSLKGETLLSQQLDILHTTEIKYAKVPTNQIEAREISGYDIKPNSFYEDKTTQILWYFDWPGYLRLYVPKTKELRSYYVGLMYNGSGDVRIIPYQDKILIMFDNRIQLFQHDGTWIKTIDFPRGEPDAIYTNTTEGENSFYFDQPNNMIYLVQGFRILSIDLLKGEVAPLFQQNNGNLGKIIYDKGRLYFTLQPNIEQQFSNEIPAEEDWTEICNLEISTGKLNRYHMKGKWSTDRLDQDQLVLWSYDKPRGSTTKGVYMRYPVHELNG
ncbi:MAG: hypothetical protein JWM44_3589 [Bacilli bacterium]|nr:hypothetical protein [Bacilli bacterium]